MVLTSLHGVVDLCDYCCKNCLLIIPRVVYISCQKSLCVDGVYVCLRDQIGTSDERKQYELIFALNWCSAEIRKSVSFFPQPHM